MTTAHAVREYSNNNKTTPIALKAKVSETTVQLYEELGIMNKVEVVARHEIELEEYTLRIQIEARTIGDIARNHVVPTAIKYQNILIENVRTRLKCQKHILSIQIEKRLLS